jgi:hypothetical protein
MRKIIVLVLVLLSCSSFAAAACRIIEYPDHSEAICDNDAEQTPSSSQITGQNQISGQEQDLASAHAAESEAPVVLPEQIVMNQLGILHAAVWLKTKSGQ